jgi:RNA polymerase sigma-70 factor (ECF subfamily)
MLSESDREVVELRHHAGMSFKSMAELLEEPIGTLLARHHRALKKLKDLMSGPGHAGPRLEQGVRP